MDGGASLDDQARAILRENDRGGYTVPSPSLYPFQWNWDSAFTALGWAEVDPDRAWQEVERLLSAQWPSGMVPHIVFWHDAPNYFPGPEVWRIPDHCVATSGISQPPVAATAVRRLAEHDRDRAAALLDALDAAHRWWHRARDPSGLGVIAASHPWETGRDNAPDWDGPLAAVDTSGVGAYERRDLDSVDATMRPHRADYDRFVALVDYGADHDWDDEAIAAGNPFWVADPGLTAILLRAERDLATMLRDHSRSADADEIDQRIARLHTGFERLWNDDVGAYCSIDLRTGRRSDAASAVSFLAPYAGVTERLGELTAMLLEWTSACEFLLPSFDPRDDRFEPHRYWRGPVWLVVSHLVAVGLAEHGEVALADRLRASGRVLVERSGFAEYFHPVTGGGLGGERFSWTAAMWLAWLR